MKREHTHIRRIVSSISFSILAVIGIVATSCKRHNLEDPVLYMANIPITIDWSESTVEVSDINNVSATFYPHDGAEPFVKVSGDPHLMTVQIGEGTYDIIIHNEMLGNIKGIDCADENIFDDFRMMIQNEDFKRQSMFYTPSPDARMIKESENVGAWSYKNFEVTREMIHYTRSSAFEELLEKMRNSAKVALTKVDSKSIASYITRGYVEALASLPYASPSITQALEDLTEVKPQPRTIRYKLTVEVVNMNNIHNAGFEAVLDGFTDEVKVLDGEKTIYPTPNFTLIPSKTNSLKVEYKKGSKTDGFINYEFTNIGHLQFVEGANYPLHLNFILHNGDKCTFEEIVTDQIQNYAIGDSIYIQVGESFNNGTGSVVLPENEEGGFGVGDWGEAEDMIL